MECSPPRALRILIVDDERSILMLLGEFLRGEGHEITTAGDGREALAAFHQGEWDVVLTDRAMPGMRGDELAAAVKAADPHMPVVMITGSVDAKRDLAAELRVDVVLRKPFKLTAVLDAINEAIAICG